MTVYRHKNSPHWQYDFQMRGQRFTGSTGCSSKSAAKEFERKERNRIAEGVVEKPDLTLDDACGLYWEQTGRFESNSKTTEGQTARLTKFFGKGTLIRDLDREEVDRYVRHRRAQKATNRQTLVKNATVNRETELLKRILRAVPDRYAKPTIDWKGVALKEAGERIRELSADEERALFEKLPGDLANVAEFAMLSGQRREGVITMLWSKMDLKAGRASVRVKGGGWHTFPLTPRMVALIASQPKVAPQVFTYVCERPAPPRKDRPRRLKGERYPFSSAGWYRKWKAALKAAGIEDFRFHDLRHTTGTRVLRSSGNLKVVQKLLGHTNITTTTRYAHALEDDVRKALLDTESRNSPGVPTGHSAENGGNLRESA